MNPLAELLYNLGALGLVGLFGYFFFWTFLAVVGTSLLISLVLMAVERALA